MSHKPMKDYSKLKSLLEDQESFPLEFTYKFIGRNSSAFAAGAQGLENAHPGLKHQTTRQSESGNHVSKTYIYIAQDADDVIRVFRAIETIPDLLVLL